MYTKTQKPLTDEMFRELIKEDYWIDRIADPVKCYDENRNFLHLHTVTYPIEYIVTEQQMQVAKERAEQRKQELIEGVKPGELVFVSMGCDYSSEMPDAVGNERIRCRFIDGKGRTLFIELCHAAMTEDFYVNAVVDIQLEEQYRRDYWEVVEHNKKTLNRNDYKPIPSVYYRLHIDYNKYIPGTWKSILQFINDNFHCNYTSARKIDHFVYIDDYVCKPTA